MTVRVNILGPLELVVDGSPIAVGSAKQRALLCMLAARPGETVSTDAIADGLWNGSLPPSAMNAIQVAVSTLRRKLGAGRDTLATRPPGYALDLRLPTDAQDAEAAVAAAPAALAAGAAEEAFEQATAALALWRGNALADVEFDEWALQHARHLAELRQSLVEARFDAGLAAGLHAQLVPELELAIAAEPLREHLRYQQVLALYRAGRQGDALEAWKHARRTLDEELGLDPGPELRALEQQVLNQDPALDLALGAGPARATAPAALGSTATAPERRTSIPAATTPMVGRDVDLAQVLRQVDEDRSRVITLVGGVGVGKSRLALAAAHDLAARPDDPRSVFVVDVAEAGGADEVTAAIARSLEVRADAQGSVAESVASVLADGPALLVLDGCDRAADAAAGLVQHLVGSCPDLTVLATGREALRIAGEQLVTVQALDVPRREIDSGGEALLDRAAASSAVQLFVQRARAVQVDFDLDEENVEQVVDICDWLEGVPLAIELCAAQMRGRTTTVLLDQLRQQALRLSSRARDLPARQRSLEAAVAWSIDQLDDDLRAAFVACGAFHGPFEASTFAQVAAALGLDGSASEDLLEELALRSLVDAESDELDPLVTRWSMLRSVRGVAAAWLEASPQREAALDAHAAVHRARAAATSELLERDELRAMHAARHEVDDVDAALARFEDRGDAEAVAEIVMHLARAWIIDGRARTGLAWAQRALVAIDTLGPAQGAMLHDAAARMARAHGRNDLAAMHHGVSLDLATASGDDRSLAAAYDGMGVDALWRCEADEAASCFERSIEHARAAGDERRLASALGSLALARFDQGRAGETYDLLARSLATYEKTGSQYGCEIIRANLAIHLQETGEHSRAWDCMETALQIARERHDHSGVVVARINLADFAIEAGDFPSALEQGGAALQGARRLGDPHLVVAAAGNVAWAALALEDTETSRGALASAAAAIRELDDARLAGHLANCLARLAAVEGDGRATRVLYGLGAELLPDEKSPWFLEQRAADIADADEPSAAGVDAAADAGGDPLAHLRREAALLLDTRAAPRTAAP